VRKDNYEKPDKNESSNESEEEKKKRLQEAWYQFNRCCYGKTGTNQCRMVGTFQLTPESFICSWHHGLSSDKNNLGEFKKWLEYHYPERDTPLKEDATAWIVSRNNKPWIKKPMIDLWRDVRGG
jgi:hypothetical protein